MIFNLANPLRFQRLIEKIEPITLNIAITLLLVGLFFCFFGSPPDYLQGETVRITGKKRDDLQETIKLVKNLNLKFPLQYVNFRD